MILFWKEISYVLSIQIIILRLSQVQEERINFHVPPPPPPPPTMVPNNLGLE